MSNSGSPFPDFIPRPLDAQPGLAPREGPSVPNLAPEAVDEFCADVSLVPDNLLADRGDAPSQSQILLEIGKNSLYSSQGDLFARLEPAPLKLSRLRDLYERREDKAINLLCSRQKVRVDDDLLLTMGTGQIHMDTTESTIDFQMTVANRMGLSALLPNAPSAHLFGFDLDLKKDYKEFRAKHGVLGFDPAGCMLFIGRSSNNEDVFLAMAPEEFLTGRGRTRQPKKPSGSSRMSKRHYRQMVIMLAYFLAEMGRHPYIRLGRPYDLDLESKDAEFDKLTDVFKPNNIRLNFEDVAALDKLLVDGLHMFVNGAPNDWKEDGFLLDRSPIVVTTCFGQNARVCVPNNENREAMEWHNERDYSKIAFLTVAIATSIQCTRICEWKTIDDDEVRRENPGPLFDSADPEFRLPVDLDTHELLDEKGLERKVYNLDGERVLRRYPVIYTTEPSCGVLVNLNSVEALFNTDPNAFKPARRDDGDDMDEDGERERRVEEQEEDEDEDVNPHAVTIDAYPLAFLRTAGNVRANGVPRCFYPILKDINESARRRHPIRHSHMEESNNEESDGGGSSSSSGGGSSSSSSGSSSSEDNRRGGQNRNISQQTQMDVDEDDEDDDDDDILVRGATTPSIFEAIKPVSCQLYNYLAHRVAARAGAHDSQQGTITGAIAGGFAQNRGDRNIATDKQNYCDIQMPHARFHTRITSVTNCPTSCRAELVYSVDVRALKIQSGSSIYTNIILPLVRSWETDDVRDAVKDHLVVFKPEVFPALFDWVSYPVTLLIDLLYKGEMETIRKGERPDPYRLELLASLERTLCFCHTGSARSLATSLMGPLGLSRGLITDGFPVLLQTFREKTLVKVRDSGFEVDRRRWPTKKGYPAVASKRAQELTYSDSHFLAYQATFRIDHALLISSNEQFPGLYTPQQNRAMLILVVALKSFVEDTKQLVKEGVKKDVAKRIANATTKKQADLAKSRGKSRITFLKLWIKSTNPLSYVEGKRRDSNHPYTHLLQAVCSNEKRIPFGLNNWTHFSTTPFAFSRLLLDMSTPVNPKSTRAPVVKTGSFLPVLKVAHKAILSITDDFSKADQQSFLLFMLKKALAHLKISFFPAQKRASEGHIGAPYTAPVFDSWGHMGLSDESGPFLIEEPSPAPPRVVVDPAQVALNHALSSDCNADWTASSITLKKLGSFLNKKSLPSDFKVPHLAKEAYVNDTHDWVRRNYNGSNPVHHLAMIVSIIVASSMLPFVFTSRDEDELFNKTLEPQMVWDIYNDMEWETRSKGGLKDKAIFISMMTTFIIGVYEPQSPLRAHMQIAVDDKKRVGLGTPWTRKYSAKGLGYVTLIRLGVVWGRDSGAYSKGTFGKTWGCHSFKTIEKFYNTLCDHLRTGDHQFGPFDALSHLMGRKNARFFATTRLGIRCRSPSEPSSSNLGVFGAAASDDDMDVDA